MTSLFFAWAFPKLKGRTVNVGVIVSVEEAKRMDKTLLSVWKRFLRDQEWYQGQPAVPHGAVMPFKGTLSQLGSGNVLLFGDAAGFVDPVGGEGLPYAVESGLNAAEAVKIHVEEKPPLLDV